MKVFYRVKITNQKNITIPYNYNISNALFGALQLGLECIPYLRVDDIVDKYELGDIILDGVFQVQFVLKKYNIVPESFDYPEILAPYLGRKVWKDTMHSFVKTKENITNGYFIKPTKEKYFTGKIISKDKDLIGCLNMYNDFEILVSEPVEFLYECRGFVYYDELKDLRPYHGDYRYMPLLDIQLIEKAMNEWKTWEERPNACSLDWGIIRTKQGEYKTILVEGNLPYALGCYGYNSIDYIKLISAYTSQLTGTKDELHF